MPIQLRNSAAVASRAELRDVGTGRECAPFSGDDDSTDARIGRGVIERAVQLVDDFRADGVQSLGTVEHDDGDPFDPFHADDVAHLSNPLAGEVPTRHHHPFEEAVWSSTRTASTRG